MNTPKTLPPIKLKNNAKSVILKNTLQNELINKLKEISNIMELKNSVEITELVCNMIENSINNNKKKTIDKKKLVINVIGTVFKLSDEEKSNFEKQIDYLFENGKIKKETIKFLLQRLIKSIPDIIKKF